MRRNLLGSLSALVVVAALLPMPAALADTITEAMSQAYMGNPTLRAARAGQRATDEQVPQALSGWRPTVSVEGTLGTAWSEETSYEIDHDANPLTPKQTVTSSRSTTPGGVAIRLAQPVFRGFATVEGTLAAESNVKAGQQNLLATEQNVLYEAVQAYMGVYSGRQLVALQQENVRVLQAQLQASNDRFAAGEITRTDVEQSRASLADAQASLATQKATLASQVAKYEQIIGHKPGKLKYPQITRMPPSLNSAFATAEEKNPNILAAAFIEDSSIHNIEVARAPLLPEISLQAQGTFDDDLSETGGKAKSASLLGVVSMPLYEAGAVYSRVREAKQLASQQRIRVIEVARAVRQAVDAAWHFLVASREVISAAKVQVSAQRLALDGVQQEYSAGTRTTLDVLNAQADVVSAQTTLVNAERAQVLAAYQLLAAIGHLTARDLKLKVPYYDPEENYDAVRNKWIGTGVETVE